MAGHWIKWEKGLCRKPEVIQIARELKLPPIHAAAHLMLLWEWADDNTEDGTVDGVLVETLDEIAGAPGIAQAMTKTLPKPWLIADKTGLTFPNYDRHNGECGKRRAVDAQRLRSWRKSKRK